MVLSLLSKFHENQVQPQKLYVYIVHKVLTSNFKGWNQHGFLRFLPLASKFVIPQTWRLFCGFLCTVLFPFSDFFSTSFWKDISKSLNPVAINNAWDLISRSTFHLENPGKLYFLEWNERDLSSNSSKIIWENFNLINCIRN